jgi:transcriptional regulator with PAS, ATPase and Fis domain
LDIAKLDHADFYQLDILSEENPGVYLENLEHYKLQYPTIRSIAHLDYFQAKALVCVRQFEGAMQLTTDLLGKAIVQRDFYLLVKCNILLSKCYYNSETKYRAKPCLELAEEYAKASQDVELLATALSTFGSYFLDTKDDKAASDYLLKAVSLIKKLPPSLTTVSVVTRAASLFHAHQDYDKVILYLGTALKLSQEAKLIVSELNIIGNMVSAYIQISKFNLAEELAIRGIQICNDYHQPNKLLQLTFNLANLKTNQNKTDEAISIYGQCLAMADSLQNTNPMLLLDIYNNYAICYGKKQEPDKALEYLNKSLEIANSINNPEQVLQVNLNKALALTNLGQYDEAKLILLEIISFYRKHKNYDVLLSAQRILALLYEKQRDYKNCVEIFKDIDKNNSEYVNKIMRDRTESVLNQIKELSTSNDNFKSSQNNQTGLWHKQHSHEFIGTSEASRKVLNSALLAAQHPNTNVFIMGESGTGKEIIANLIHYNSLRRDFPFVPVNTSAINASLVESELFGHLKGSFTGALNDTKGFFMQAHKGTLFLDEITEMPIEFQAKLLRALESRKVTPVGSSSEIAFDSRIVSSSNRNIYDLMQQNQFRLDLFHRINPIEIYIPPLRNRTEDIEVLVHHFIDIFTIETKKAKPQVTQSFIKALQQYPFPGNIRELRNIIERLFIMSSSHFWDADVLSLINLGQNNYGTPLVRLYGKLTNEDDVITKALIQAGGKQKDAAKLLNMSESTLTRRIVKYELENYTRKGK